MARQKSAKKIDSSNPAVAVPTPAVPSIPAVHNNLQAETTPAINPSVQPVASKPATLEAKGSDARKPEIVKPEIVKREIVKKEGRGNIVPINLDEEIRRLAYLLSERRGFTPGHEAEDWTNAEREVRQRYHQQSA
jgi:Protein of unknown function (DUF2934)